MPKKRNYKREYELYHSSPEQKKKRAKRNAARRQAERDGRVRKGDGKDIDHKRPLRAGGGNSKGNLRVRDKSENRADNGGAGGRPRKKMKGRR